MNRLKSVPNAASYGRGRIVVDELEIDHVGGIAEPRTELDDPRVPTWPVCEPWRHLREEGMHDVVRPQRRERLSPRVQVAPLAERDQLLGIRLDRLRLRLGRPDPLVREQRARKVRVERLAVSRVAAELLP